MKDNYHQSQTSHYSHFPFSCQEIDRKSFIKGRQALNLDLKHRTSPQHFISWGGSQMSSICLSPPYSHPSSHKPRFIVAKTGFYFDSWSRTSCKSKHTLMSLLFSIDHHNQMISSTDPMVDTTLETFLIIWYTILIASYKSWKSSFIYRIPACFMLTEGLISLSYSGFFFNLSMFFSMLATYILPITHFILFSISIICIPILNAKPLNLLRLMSLIILSSLLDCS